MICVDGHGKSLDDSACSKLNKPKTMRRCPKCKMEFLWVNGTWSEVRYHFYFNVSNEPAHFKTFDDLLSATSALLLVAVVIEPVM